MFWKLKISDWRRAGWGGEIDLFLLVAGGLPVVCHATCSECHYTGRNDLTIVIYVKRMQSGDHQSSQCRVHTAHCTLQLWMLNIKYGNVPVWQADSELWGSATTWKNVHRWSPSHHTHTQRKAKTFPIFSLAFYFNSSFGWMEKIKRYNRI